MSTIFIISGPSGSGKTSLARTLAPTLSARIINAGDVVLGVLRANKIIPRSRADAGRLFLEVFGDTALGPLLERAIAPCPRVMIDGLRLPHACDLLSRGATSTFHIYLDASRDTRRERLILRDGHDNIDNIADSYAPWMRQRADLIVANESSDHWSGVALDQALRPELLARHQTVKNRWQWVGRPLRSAG